jgi:hypothetical protein
MSTGMHWNVPRQESQTRSFEASNRRNPGSWPLQACGLTQVSRAALR